MIIIEGLDGTGKTSLSEGLMKYGYKKHHFDYDRSSNDLYKKYLDTLQRINRSDLIILDRSFISELVYGPVLRQRCRLSEDQLVSLIQEYNRFGFILVYLHSSQEILLERRKSDENDYKILCEYYDKLRRAYEETVNKVKHYIEVVEVDTGITSIEQAIELVVQNVKKKLLTASST